MSRKRVEEITAEAKALQEGGTPNTPDEPWKNPEPSTKHSERSEEAEAPRAKSRHEIAREAERAARKSREQATEQDAVDTGAAIRNANSSRLSKLNAIAAKGVSDSGEDAARELSDWDGEKVVTEDPEEKQRQADETERKERERLTAEAEEEERETQHFEEQEARELQGETKEEASKPKLITRKINGKDVTLSLDEWLNRAAKVSAADEYLANAKALTRSNEAVKETQPLAPSQDVRESVEEVDTEKLLTSALQGEPEAIKQVAQRLKAPPIDGVLRAVDDKFAKLSFESAVARFRGENPELFSTADLYARLVAEDSMLAQSEPALPYLDRLHRAAENVRYWDRGRKGGTTLNPKLARKAQLAPVPQAGGRQTPRREEEAEEDVETVIDQMARSRNQGQAVRKRLS